MKRTLSLYALCCLALLGMLTACSEDLSDNAVSSGNNRVSIASAMVGTATRAAADATAFQTNDQISLSTSANGNGAATYTLATDDWNSDTPLAWGNTFPVTYYAAYPATATYNNFTLPTDQSTGTADANYLTATAIAQQKEPLTLAFKHRTAQIVIKIAGRAAENEGTLSGATVYSPHSRYENGTPAGEASTITPQTVTPAAGEEVRYTALVLPGTADGFKLFSVKVGGKEVSFTTDIEFKENHIYEYTLTIGADRVVLAGFTVKEWTKKNLTASMTPQWDGQVAESYAGGDGSKDSPYQIATPAQLALLAREVNNGTITYNKYLILTADIDLGGSNWTPIGYSNSFYCDFDGQGHTIRNLHITRSDVIGESGGFEVGLFGKVWDASIRNLTVENVVINISTTKNQWQIGVIAGNVRTSSSNKTATIDNCHVADAEIIYREDSDLNSSIGGIAGSAPAYSYLSPITFSRCTVDDINVNSDSSAGQMAAGGILGRVSNGQVQIYACSTSGTLTGMKTGGLVGYNSQSLLTASGCYANCTLNGETSAAIAILNKINSNPIIQWSYLAGLQSDALRRGVEPGGNGTWPTKEDECYLVTEHSEVYSIVANEVNDATFTVAGTKYYVRDCWQDNGTALPTLKVSKDGKTTTE